MEISIKDIAKLVSGKIIGNENLYVTDVARIQDAQPGDLTFFYLPQYKKYLETTKATAVLISKEEDASRSDLTYILVESPDKAFQKVIITFFNPEFKLTGIDETAYIHPTVQLGDNVAVGKFVVISENCKIGDDTKIYHGTVIMENVEIGSGNLIFPNVTIRENCITGNNVIIHSGSVIGSDGFGYSTDEKGVYHKIPQIGNVVVEDDVEIGSNVSIDRAAVGSTVIKKGVKLDNLIQVAHNVTIGENTVISGQAGVSGSTKIGKNCVIAGQVGIAGHLEITDKVLIGAQSGISKSIKKPGIYFGYPAKEMSVARKLEAHIRNLPNYSNRIKELENKIKELENKLISSKEKDLD